MNRVQTPNRPRVPHGSRALALGVLVAAVLAGAVLPQAAAAGASSPAQQPTLGSGSTGSSTGRDAMPPLTGTLTVPWGGMVVDVDLQTGTATERFEGREPDRAKNGETVIMIGSLLSSQILIVSRDGTTRTRVVGDCRRCGDLRLSPDGTAVAYSGLCEECGRDPQGRGGTPTVVRTRDGTLLQAFWDLLPGDWTPDGRLLLYGSPVRGTAGLYLTDPQLTGVTRIDPDVPGSVPGRPRVSPDGQRVAFARGGHVWVMALDGSSPTQVTASDAFGGEVQSFPVWSPDGAWLAVTHAGAFHPFPNVHLVAAAGQQQVPTIRLRHTTGEVVTRGRMSWH